MKFTEEYSFEHRLAEATKIRAKYPDRIPIIVSPSDGSFFSKQAPELDKKKYLVPDSLTVGQFQYIIRKRLKLEEHQAMFLFVNNTLLPTSELISKVDHDFKSSDNFIYFSYALENTFG
jgi:GABA(A) receptor-associated protein